MTYIDLVEKRKAYNLQIEGLINAADIKGNEYDIGQYLEPWAKWQNSCPAQILLVGQDWGGQKYYLKNNGRDDDQNPTCKNLITLFKQIKIDIGLPSAPIEEASVHFTNIIPFLRTGQMQGSLDKILTQTLINAFANEFTKPLIEMVEPQIIITLGMAAFKGITTIYEIAASGNIRLKDIVGHGPIILKGGLLLFPMFHCGSSGVNRNRKLIEQMADWDKIVPYLKKRNNDR
jgi:hypothetical protein